MNMPEPLALKAAQRLGRITVDRVITPHTKVKNRREDVPERYFDLARGFPSPVAGLELAAAGELDAGLLKQRVEWLEDRVVLHHSPSPLLHLYHCSGILPLQASEGKGGCIVQGLHVQVGRLNKHQEAQSQVRPLKVPDDLKGRLLSQGQLDQAEVWYRLRSKGRSLAAGTAGSDPLFSVRGRRKAYSVVLAG